MTYTLFPRKTKKRDGNEKGATRSTRTQHPKVEEVEKLEEPSPEIEEEEQSQDASSDLKTPPASGEQEDSQTSSTSFVDEEAIKAFNRLLSQFPSGHVVSFLPTGSVVLDRIWGGGLPLGKYIEIRSPAGLGKTTISLHVAKSILAQGYGVVFMDFEKALNESLLVGVGVKEYLGQGFFLHKGTTFTDAETILDTYLSRDIGIRLIVVDSITAFLPSRLRDKPVEDIEPGLTSRLVATFLLKYKDLAARNNCSIIFINQMRMKFDTQGRQWRSYEDSAGGKAFEFYADIRTDLQYGDDILENPSDKRSLKLGVDLAVQTIKNKVTKPYVRGVLSVYFGLGISNVRAYALYLEEMGAIKQAGAYYQIDLGGGLAKNVRGRQGRDEWLAEHEPQVIDFLKRRGFLR